MKLTDIEEMTLRDILSDGGRAVMTRSGKKCLSDRENWVTSGIKHLHLDTRTVKFLASKGAIEIGAGCLSVIREAEEPAFVKPLDLGWIG